MSRFQMLALTLTVALAMTFADSVKKDGRNGADIKRDVIQLVSHIRRVTTQAKGGAVLKDLRRAVLHLQTAASDFIVELPGEVSERDVALAIKMATSGAGNHEILAALLADDVPRVLNGRLTLSLAFLERAAQLLNDELKLTDDVSPQLAAIVFGTNVTLNVIDTAEKELKPKAELSADAHIPGGKVRVRRQSLIQPTFFPPSRTFMPPRYDDWDNFPTFGPVFTLPTFRPPRSGLDLGGGWGLGTRGLEWESSNGRFGFSTRPTFRGFTPDGFQSSFSIRF